MTCGYITINKATEKQAYRMYAEKLNLTAIMLSNGCVGPSFLVKVICNLYGKIINKIIMY